MLIEIPFGPDWKEKLTPEQRAALPGIDDPPPKPRFERRRPPTHPDVIETARLRGDLLRELAPRRFGNLRGTEAAMTATICEIVEDAIVSRPLHVRPSFKRR